MVFIRSLIGSRPNPEDRLLAHLLGAGEKILISELSPGEVELVRELKESELVEVDSQLRVELTGLGRTVARGAKKLFPDL